MAQRYRKTPAEILFLDDEYTSYCLNEACAVIISHLDKDEQPLFETHYSSVSELYKSILDTGRR